MNAKTNEAGTENKKVEAYGVRGMKSTNWRKTFKNWAAYEAWCEKNDGDVQILGVREI